MKKGIMIAIGIVIAIVIGALVIGLNVNTGKEARIAQPPTSVNSTVALPTPSSSIHGKNFSINLTESVGSTAH